MANADILYALGTTLIFVGVVIIALAFFLPVIQGARKGRVKGGGAVIIGPVPIIFGTDKKSLKTVLLLSLAFTMLVAVLMLLSYLLHR